MSPYNLLEMTFEEYFLIDISVAFDVKLSVHILKKLYLGKNSEYHHINVLVSQHCFPKKRKNYN